MLTVKSVVDLVSIQRKGSLVMKDFHLSILISIIAFVLTMNAALSAEAQRPNIILLIADDLGYGELGCQGNPQVPTPHIDSIAKAGVRFTQGYVTASFCSASRAGLFTGRYQSRFGYEINPVGALNEDPAIGLPVNQATLADLLHDRGYATSLVGKWHLGATAKYHPQRRGFDEFFGFLHEGHSYVPPPYREVVTMLRRKALPDRAGKGEASRWESSDGRLILSSHMGHDEPAYDTNNPLLRSSQPVEEREHLTDAFTREAVDFIARSKERPFFLCVAYNAVHSPLQGADAYMKKFESVKDVHRRIFCAMLAHLDDSVGAILKRVRDERMEERTLIIFLSDNGGPTRELTSSNLPLRGGKGQLYEGGVRVPFMMQHKGVIPSGKLYEKPVISLDLFTTIAAASGGPPPRAGRLDGVDLMPFLRGEDKSTPHDTLYWRMNEGASFAVRRGDWKLVSHRGKSAELFDLANDVSESRDLAAKEPVRMKAMREAYDQWVADFDALPKP
ncbi:MAG: sulfatase-like hydrolase/transferase [Phycisphaeraceae bacterium]